MSYPKTRNDFRQERIVMGFDHDAPGIDLAAGGVAAGGTLAADTKANSTDLDAYILNDGQARAMLWYNVSGTQVAKYSKLGSYAASTLTCDTKANTANEGYASIFDGRNTWDIMMDTDASGDSTGNAHVVVDVSGATTAADIVALIVADVNAQAAAADLSTVGEAMHIVATASGNDVVFTSTLDGYNSNGACSVTTLANAWAVTASVGGTDTYPVEEFAECDISGATTAQDVQTVIHGVINALTEVKITSTDPANGDSLALANDETGLHGNTAQEIIETGSTLMALSDMSGGLAVDATGATEATKLFTVQKLKFRADKIEYINPTGFANDATNFWVITVKAGATVMATWSTETGEEGALGADTVNEMTLASAPDYVADQDDVISIALTKAASAATLPAGRVVIHGRYL